MTPTPSPAKQEAIPVEQVPDWAIERALTRFPNPKYMDGKPWSNISIRTSEFDYAKAVRFLAEQIEIYEEAPVDPLYEALFAVADIGSYDTREQTLLLRNELKARGLELVEIGGSK